jgi:hypothetical protein
VRSREVRVAPITTRADAGVDIQISLKVGRLVVDGDVKTTAGRGDSASRARGVPLPAYGVSI